MLDKHVRGCKISHILPSAHGSFYSSRTFISAIICVLILHEWGKANQKS